MIRPQMRPGNRVDQLTGNADPIATLAHRAFEHITDTEFAADPLDVDVLALIGEARITGSDEQPANARKGGDDLLDHAVGEIFLLRIAAEIEKRQHGERRLFRNRDFPRNTQQYGSSPDSPLEGSGFEPLLPRCARTADSAT